MRLPVRWVSLARRARCLWLALPLAWATACPAAPGHPASFWQGLKEQQFKLDAQQSAPELAAEAAGLLHRTDPEIRDGIGYEALAAWIYRDQLLSAPELQQLQVQLLRSATQGLGHVGDDSLFARSFSILALSLLAAEDLKKPFLTPAQYTELVNLGTRSLAQERDLRGYVPGKGWGHATAHTADLLKFLARNPQLQPVQQQHIVEAVVGRLHSAGMVFVWGEDARLAAALASIARRPDADAGNFARWFDELRAAHRRLWEGRFDTARYVAERAQLNALAELSLALDSDPSTPGAPAIRELMRAASRDLR
ncbi:MAG: DUF2785 domain-containing protein [Proteobacteria bacterium]|nr:DUF2785 domain-containing protein [Pseudomonadota bacterium]